MEKFVYIFSWINMSEIVFNRYLVQASDIEFKRLREDLWIYGKVHTWPYVN
jgi:hypothetical protein